ncbi:MAG: hypothetical protein KKD33_01640, partial [Verrucomicrobia bacterium]|nr:hypothetical protein [Verrucomicrobiota bacterium]
GDPPRVCLPHYKGKNDNKRKTPPDIFIANQFVEFGYEHHNNASFMGAERFLSFPTRSGIQEKAMLDSHFRGNDSIEASNPPDGRDYAIIII